MNARANIVGVDWGSTNLRAFRFHEDGHVQESRRGGLGAIALDATQFEGALTELIGDWISADTRVIVCGMAGRRSGWVEAPYLACPAGLAEVAAHLVPAPARTKIWIVPGLTSTQGAFAPDVMRGEETQILGALDLDEPVDQFIAPGTHSKWVKARDRRIHGFSTFMTGEVFALMRKHSMLAQFMQADAPDEAAFARGVRRSIDHPGLLNNLFSVRCEALANACAPEAQSAYLSGLLIGAEIEEGARQLNFDSAAATAIIGAPELAAPYQRALALAGFKHTRLVDGEAAAARGLWRLAQTSEFR